MKLHEVDSELKRFLYKIVYTVDCSSGTGASGRSYGTAASGWFLNIFENTPTLADVLSVNIEGTSITPQNLSCIIRNTCIFGLW